MSVTPEQLNVDVQKAIADINALIVVAENIPGLPDSIKTPLVDVQTVLASVAEFLKA